MEYLSSKPYIDDVGGKQGALALHPLIKWKRLLTIPVKRKLVNFFVSIRRSQAPLHDV